MNGIRYAVALDRAAQRDLEQIYDYVREHAGGRVAAVYVRRIHEFCRTFARFPE